MNCCTFRAIIRPGEGVTPWAWAAYLRRGVRFQGGDTGRIWNQYYICVIQSSTTGCKAQGSARNLRRIGSARMSRPSLAAATSTFEERFEEGSCLPLVGDAGRVQLCTALGQTLLGRHPATSIAVFPSTQPAPIFALDSDCWYSRHWRGWWSWISWRGTLEPRWSRCQRLIWGAGIQP